MKKFLLIFVALMIPCTTLADDRYYKTNHKWETEFDINTHVVVKSVNKLNSYRVNLIQDTYILAEEKFLELWNLQHNECRFMPLEIKVVRSHNELDSKKLFPRERVYADKPGEGTNIIFGRYFKVSNMLYIVPPYTAKYYWKENFAHEILHYFFDECGIKFDSGEEEHMEVERFIKQYEGFFY